MYYINLERKRAFGSCGAGRNNHHYLAALQCLPIKKLFVPLQPEKVCCTLLWLNDEVNKNIKI